VFLDFLEIGSIVQVPKGFGGPVVLVPMGIDDEEIPTRTHDALQFGKDRARAYHVMQQHMAHRDINGTRREREVFGHALTEGDVLVVGLGHLLASQSKHGGRAVYTDDVPYKGCHHARKVAGACTGIEHRHILVPGKEPDKPFLQVGLIGTSNIVIPDGSDAIKIGLFMRFEMP
jgi:hypothetical protein